MICYAHLADVPAGDSLQSLDSAFSKSRWFTRGWTLQELIAPAKLDFFSSDWQELGDRSRLAAEIAEITGIASGILTGTAQLRSNSVAQRMSWASRRQTTRSEDMAYCLMGLFDVNMPLLYGEGTKAFIRLQEEILKRSNDHSLFAWTCAMPDVFERKVGFLAKSPADFEHSQHYHSSRFSRETGLDRPYAMTNMGLCIDLPVFGVPGRSDQFIAILACMSTDDPFRDNKIGLYIHLDNLNSAWTGSWAVSPEEKTLPSSSRALRDVYRGPMILKVTDIGQQKSVTVNWDFRNRDRLAPVCTLYVSQEGANDD